MSSPGGPGRGKPKYWASVRHQRCAGRDQFIASSCLEVGIAGCFSARGGLGNPSASDALPFRIWGLEGSLSSFPPFFLSSFFLSSFLLLSCFFLRSSCFVLCPLFFSHASSFHVFFLPSFLPFFLSSFLPSFLSFFLPSFLPSFLPFFLSFSRSFSYPDSVSVSV